MGLADVGGDGSPCAWRRLLFCGQIFIDGGGGFAAFGDGPDNEGLAATHVAGGEDAFTRGHKVGGGDIAALVQSEAKLLDHAVADRTEETHGEQHEIDVEGELGAGNGLEFGGGPTRTA